VSTCIHRYLLCFTGAADRCGKQTFPAGAFSQTSDYVKFSKKFSKNFCRATSVSVEDSVGLITISAVYLPSRHTVKLKQLED
jgi:hypothetical protein